VPASHHAVQNRHPDGRFKLLSGPAVASCQPNRPKDFTSKTWLISDLVQLWPQWGGVFQGLGAKP
jgi:hypothetical protein